MSQTEPAGPSSSNPLSAGAEAAFTGVRDKLNGILRWRPGFGTVMRSGVLFSAVALVATFLGREGILLSSSMDVAALDSKGPAPEGVVYFLSKSVVEIETTYQLQRCDVRAGPDGPIVTIQARVTPKISNVFQPDFNRGYVIKASTISGGFWNTDVKLELANGRLSRFGVRSESTVSAPKQVSTVVPFSATGAPAPLAPAADTLAMERERICGKDVVQALDRVRGASMSVLTTKRALRIEPGRACPAGTEQLPADTDFGCVLRGTNTVGRMIQSPGDAKKELERHDLILRLAEIERAPVRSVAETRGLVYRIPGSARLMTCLFKCDEDDEDARVLTSETISIPQFGVEVSIPIERRLFSNRTTELEFAPSGELRTIHFSDVATEDKKKDANDKGSGPPNRGPLPPTN